MVIFGIEPQWEFVNNARGGRILDTSTLRKILHVVDSCHGSYVA